MLSCAIALLVALSSLQRLFSSVPFADVAPALSVCVVWILLAAPLILSYFRNLEIVGGENGGVRKRG